MNIKYQIILAFMKIIKGRENSMSASKYERRLFLNHRVIWDRSIDRLEVFRNNFQVHYEKIGEG
jgi:hypothetical protein